MNKHNIAYAAERMAEIEAKGGYTSEDADDQWSKYCQEKDEPARATGAQKD